MVRLTISYSPIHFVPNSNSANKNLNTNFSSRTTNTFVNHPNRLDALLAKNTFGQSSYTKIGVVNRQDIFRFRSRYLDERARGRAKKNLVKKGKEFVFGLYGGYDDTMKQTRLPNASLSNGWTWFNNLHQRVEVWLGIERLQLLLTGGLNETERLVGLWGMWERKEADGGVVGLRCNLRLLRLCVMSLL